SGSAGVGMAIAVDVMLADSSVQCIPTTMYGPLGRGLSVLLLGRSSTTHKGLFVLPGVIDSDFQGTIHAMLWTPSPPIHVPAGEKIAQLVPFQSCIPQAVKRKREGQGFSSTGIPEIHLALEISKQKPMKRVTLKDPPGRKTTVNMLIDTGADVTIAS
ncbi:POK9 protein, partial [Eudromia elegans]|nr:POK9 protein [Eudromia elegans]